MSTLQSLDERGLAAAFRGGDLVAFSELVRRHHRRLFVIALRRTGSVEVAEDALQDALSKVYRHLAALPEDADVGAWLATVVDHAAIDQLRRESRHRRLADRAFEAAPERSDRSAGTRRSEGSPLGRIEREELGEILGDALDTLPENYRKALELYHLRGLPVEEVAAVLHMNVNTVKSHLARGRSALRRRLQGRLRRGGWL